MPASHPLDTAPARSPRVRPVPAVSRAIAILRLLGDAGQPMGVKAIADALELVPSTCLHILRVLVSEGLVAPEQASKRYVLGSGMISLARSVLQGGGFTQLVQPALDRLAARASVTAMGVEITARQAVVVLAISRSHQHFRLHTDVGSQFDTMVSATGRLIAAYGPDNWVQLRKKFALIPWDQPLTYEVWKKEVEVTRRRGWAVDRDHFLTGVTVVAVPVFNTARQMTHTLVVIGLSSQLDDATVQALAKDMRREAEQISDAMLGP